MRGHCPCEPFVLRTVLSTGGAGEEDTAGRRGTCGRGRRRRRGRPAPTRATAPPAPRPAPPPGGRAGTDRRGGGARQAEAGAETACARAVRHTGGGGTSAGPSGAHQWLSAILTRFSTQLKAQAVRYTGGGGTSAKYVWRGLKSGGGRVGSF